MADYANPSGATLVTFATGGNGIKNYPVNGNLDIGYNFSWDLIGNASGAVFRIELNGGTTNQTSQFTQGTGSALSGGTNTNFGQIGNNGNASARFQGELIIPYSATGFNRGCYFVTLGNASTNTGIHGCGKYADSSTNITSIRFNVTAGTISGTIWMRVKSLQQASF